MASSNDKQIKRRFNLLIGITGSVAAIKLNELAEKFFRSAEVDFNVCVIATEKAQMNFIPDFEKCFNKPTIKTIDERLRLLMSESKNDSEKYSISFSDQDEWSTWTKRDDPVLHIELRRWADLFLIAPLDANTLAKLSCGMCDNLLTCVARAWDMADMKQKPIVICPAMNTAMYEHPITSKQLTYLISELNYLLIDSVEKRLMCGDVGKGAMANLNDIYDLIIKIFSNKNSTLSQH